MSKEVEEDPLTNCCLCNEPIKMSQIFNHTMSHLEKEIMTRKIMLDELRI